MATIIGAVVVGTVLGVVVLVVMSAVLIQFCDYSNIRWIMNASRARTR